MIVSPDYDYTSGGIKVMWALYGHLLARGHEVYMNRYPHADVVAIYPEIYGSNPIGAKTVVRYILNKLGVMHGAGEPLKEINPHEHNYYFSRLFGDTDDDHYMFLPVINLDIFKDQKKNRDKTDMSRYLCMLLFKPVDDSIRTDIIAPPVQADRVDDKVPDDEEE